MTSYVFIGVLLMAVIGLYAWSRFKQQRDYDRYEAEAKLAMVQEQENRDDREEARQRHRKQSHRPVLVHILEHEPHLQTQKESN